MPEDNSGYKLSQPKQSLAEYHKMGMFQPLSLLFVFFSASHASYFTRIFSAASCGSWDFLEKGGTAGAVTT
ncbi:uncharacterized protein B0T23DRAFT_386150, partial [Neurospora hispaniola]